MSIEEILRLILSAMAGLGIGSFINSIFIRRWERQKEGSKAIGEVIGRLIGIVGSAKDDIAVNERVISEYKAGKINSETASVRISYEPISIGTMEISARIMCKSAKVDAQPFLLELQEYRLTAIEYMRWQKELVEGERDEIEGENFVLKMNLAEKENKLVGASASLFEALKKAKF